MYDNNQGCQPRQVAQKAATGMDELAFQYAVKQLIYPVLDERERWFKPLMLKFTVNRDQVLAIKEYLEETQQPDPYISYYEFEKQARQNSWGLGLTRSDLIYTCRYLRLHGIFGEDFWAMFCERGKCPIEADLIVMPFDRA